MPPSKQHIHAFLKKEYYGVFSDISLLCGYEKSWLSQNLLRGIRSGTLRKLIIEKMNLVLSSSYKHTDFIW